MDEEEFWLSDEESWRCRKHPSHRQTVVCPRCLRDDLLRLCSDCAKLRPCGCSASFSSNSSSSTGSSSISICFYEPEAVGPVGLVSDLIGREPAFRRSKSTAIRRILQGSDNVREEKRTKSKGLRWIWPFSKEKKREEVVMEGKGKGKGKEGVEDVVEDLVMLHRSRSVGVQRSASVSQPARYSHSSVDGGGVGGEGRWRGRNWYFPSPMKVFGHHRHKATGGEVVHQVSPLCRR